MCEICSMTKENRRVAYLYRSKQLNDFAEKIRLLAHGNIDPHTPEAKLIAESAKDLIRFLVEDWL